MSGKIFKSNLLVICHSYNNFVKDWVDEISLNFDNVYVFVRHNTFFDVVNFFKKGSYAHRSVDYKISYRNKPLNVNIFITPLFYLPLNFFFKKAGDKHFQSVIKQIKQSQIHFDLVHAHFTWTSGYVAAKLREEHNVPAVITAHGFDIYDLPFRDGEWTSIISSVLNHVDYIITVSHKNLQSMGGLHVKTPKAVIPNGYCPELFRPLDVIVCREKLKLDLNKTILLSVGNLTKVKGHRYLIEAMSTLLEERDDLILIIIGGGPLMNKYESLISNLGLTDNIFLIGSKPHHEIPYWMGACDLFVLPSLNEGNPTVMFEALGCGRPFIGTEVGGIPDIITDEKLGMVVEPANAAALANAISKSLSINWDCEHIAGYSKKYTWSNIVQETLKTYNTLLK